MQIRSQLFYCNKSGQHLQAWAHSLLLFEITLNTYRIAVALVSSSSNRVLFSKTYNTGLLLWSKISALQHIRFGPDWLHHSVQGVFWDNETRKWLKYLVWQRETLSRAVLLSGCGFSYCKSCTVWSPCSLATALSQSGAKITAERLEVVRSALLRLSSQSFPHMWFNLSRWTAHAVFTACFPPECKAVGNWCKWDTRTCDSTRNSVLQEIKVTQSAISDVLRKLQNRPQSWNRELCLLQTIGWNLISDTANEFRNCLLLTAALSILCAE